MVISLLVFLPILVAPFVYILGRRNEKLRDDAVIVFTFLMLALAVFQAVSVASILSNAEDAAPALGLPGLDIPGVFVYGLSFTADGFRAVYSLVTAIMWAGTTLFSKEYFAHEREGLDRYWMFVIMTLGATQGVMLSADLMTSFVFFEILSLTSFTWVIHEETAGAIRAAYTYLFIAVIGGLVLFMGLLLVRETCGTLAFRDLAAAVSSASQDPLSGRRIFAGAVCILFGFGCKAGMFPVHVWLPKAHPVAPSPGSALLSGILTKVGVYGIIMTATQALFGSRAFGLLIFTLGLVTMFLGALLALFSVNLKRTLACSSMSQIGFILTGIGMATFTNALGEAHGEEGVTLALSGAMLHMVNHSLLKLVLFMAAGVVVMNLHKLNLDDIRGWGRNKIFLKIAFALGGLGISGVPLFNGYISKTMLHEGIVHGIEVTEAIAGMEGLHAFFRIGEWVFLISGGFTFAYMLKLFICVFLERNRDEAVQAVYDENPACMNPASTVAVFGSSIFMVILGQPFVMTHIATLMNGREEILEFAAFTFENLKGGFISLGIGALLYIFVVRRVLMRDGSYVNLWPSGLDLEDMLYRPLLTKWLPDIGGTVARVFGENLILTPVCRCIVFLGSLIGRILCDSTDALILLLRKSIVREMPVRARHDMTPTRMEVFLRDTNEAVSTIFTGFSFALGMTCFGVLLILGVLAYLLFF